tara:strand:- start:151 stop:567 length:417 start_codon:yes stop_codon:yes gene_type:complete
MNSLLFFIIVVPALEIYVFIKVGNVFGAVSTILLIISTAVIGVYFAKLEGLNTLRSGLKNVYNKKSPVNEILSGASIAFGATLLIVPGFITDVFGFLLIIPFTRNFLVNLIVKQNNIKEEKKDEVIEAEIIDDKKDEL